MGPLLMGPMERVRVWPNRFWANPALLGGGDLGRLPRVSDRASCLWRTSYGDWTGTAARPSRPAGAAMTLLSGACFR